MGRRSRNKQPAAKPPWTPFKLMQYWETPEGRIPIPDHYVVFTNSRYSVTCCKVDAPEPFGVMVWLSIKRLDREAVHDWRDLQRIKNELCGPTCEAVELYPAEERNHDTSNQMHLWVTRSGFQFPFGYKYRAQVEHPELDPASPTAKQRPFDDDNRPPDVTNPILMTNKELSTIVAPIIVERWTEKNYFKKDRP